MKVGDNSSSYHYLPKRSSQTAATPAEASYMPAGSGQAAGAGLDTGSSASSALSNLLWLNQASDETTDKARPDSLFGETDTDTESSSELLDEISRWAKMSLGEKIRAQYLESRGLSEEDLNAMSADERKIIEDEIRRAILQQTGIDGVAKTAAGDDSAAASA